MKLQFLINSLTSGGAERVASTLLNELSKSKEYEIFVYTLEKDKFYELNKRIHYKPLSNLTGKSSAIMKILTLPFSFFKYLILTKRNNPNILFSFLELSNFINVLTARLLRKKVIISVHTNPLVMYPKNNLYGQISRFLIKFFYPKADKIITISKGTQDILNNSFNVPKRKMLTIYNPHNVDTYLTLSKEPLDKKYEHLFRGHFVFVNVGRLTEAKGQWFLIRSFGRVVDAYSNAKLIILGDGDLRGKLQSLIHKLNLENNVFLLGVQKNPFKFLRRSDCFVFSSLWEGLPNTVIEALSMNLPVVSTDCKTGPREILAPEIDVGERIDYPYYGEYGVLTKTLPRKFVFGDLKEQPLLDEEKLLSDLMIKMIEDSKLRKKYSKGLKRAEDFDVKKIIEKWDSLFILI